MGAVISGNTSLQSAADELFESQRTAIFRRTDRLFGMLMIVQWIGCVAAAEWVSPRSWIGLSSSIHLHVTAAILLGGLITVLPVMLAIKRPGMAETRYVIATAQMLMGSLLIHVTGGQIETHFHIFGSLAFIATYRDWRALMLATLVVAADHIVRGALFPLSIYGVAGVGTWRTLSHIWWVVFEDAFLFTAYATSTREMRSIAQRTAELNVARLASESATAQARLAMQAAEEASRGKSEFVANMSHEIRTPLNAVLGTVELLLGTSLTAGQRRYAQVARGSGKALMSLLNNILDYSKMEAHKLELFETTFDLPELIEEVADMFSSTVYAKGLSLATFIDPTLNVPITGDAERIRQVLNNLISNAIKFTERGQIVLRIWADADNDDEIIARFTVTDSGIGIAPQKMTRLFQSFSQADASTTRQYGGTGLGLAISKQLVQLMSGEMGVSSREGAGSTFWFTLPLKKSSALPIKQSCTATPQIRRTLLVDGSTAHREVIARQIKSHGLQNIAVATAAEAIAAIAAANVAHTPYEVILIDHQLPDLSAERLAATLRSDGCSAVLMRVATPDEIRSRVEEASDLFDGQLIKPVRQSELMEAMLQALANRQTRQSKPAGEAHAENAVLPAVLSTAQSRLLLVEDNEINQLVAIDLLRNAGFVVEVASNGKAAIDAVRARHFDLILMDCQMPVMDGYEATAAIREMEAARTLPIRTGRLPIMALTANAFQKDIDRCHAAGMDDHLPKPIDPQKMLDTIARMLPQRPDASTFSAAVAAA